METEETLAVPEQEQLPKKKRHRKRGRAKKPAVQAVLAGNDLILVKDYATAYNDILAAVKDGTISETQLKDAVTRVLSYKYTVGIMK